MTYGSSSIPVVKADVLQHLFIKSSWPPEQGKFGRADDQGSILCWESPATSDTILCPNPTMQFSKAVLVY